MTLNIHKLEARGGDLREVPFRSNRFFCVGDKWYFSTREGFDSGPYADKDRAKTGLDRFLHIVSLLPADNRVH